MSMPPRLNEVLASLGTEAQQREYDLLVQDLGTDNVVGFVRLNSQERIDATDMLAPEARAWLAARPVEKDAEVSVCWADSGTGAKMEYSKFVNNFDDLWYPSMDDVIVAANSDHARVFLLLDHEEQFSCYLHAAE